MRLNYKLIITGIIALAILMRIILLFMTPISMFADGVIRYLPNAQQILQGDFSFYSFPLFILLEAFWMLFLSGKLLWLAWKATSFVFFVAILFMLSSFFKKFNLNKEEKIMLLALFLFSTWSLLLSVTVMQDMMFTFFVLATFLAIERYFDRPCGKGILSLIILTSLMCLTKQTGYIILLGFGLYILLKKKPVKTRIKPIVYLILGTLPSVLWLAKTYIMKGTARIWISSAIPSPSIPSLQNFMAAFAEFYHYLWEIPQPAKVNLEGILGLFFNIYYAAAIIITALLIVTTILGLIKYGRKYKSYILLMLPLMGFSLFYEPFIIWGGGSPNPGRYSFPLWLFLFLFPVRFISSIKKQKIKLLGYLMIAGFCFISIASAYGIAGHINSIDKQIVDMSEKLKEKNAVGNFVTNDEFTGSALSFYLGQPVKFNLRRNIRDVGVNCFGEHIFFSKNFDVFKGDSEYRVCRW